MLLCYFILFGTESHCVTLAGLDLSRPGWPQTCGKSLDSVSVGLGLQMCSKYSSRGCVLQGRFGQTSPEQAHLTVRCLCAGARDTEVYTLVAEK